MHPTPRLNRNAVACIIHGRLACYMPRAISPGFWRTEPYKFEPIANAPENVHAYFMRRVADHACVIVMA